MPFTPTGPVVGVGPLETTRTNYKLGAELDVADSSTLYATYATGFKGGGFAQTLACGADPFSPEGVNALTLGSRNRFADNRPQLNVEAFYWKYKYQQISFVGLDRCGGTTLLTRSPGDATIKGASVDPVFKPVEAGSLRVVVEFNDAKYDSFALTQLGLGVYAPAGGTRCSNSPATGSLVTIDCTGQRLTRTPRWSGTVGYQHDFPLGRLGNITVSGEMLFASQRWLDFSYVPNTHDNSYQLYNAQLAWRPSGDQLTLSLYMNKITNTAIYTGSTTAPQLAPNGFRIALANIMPPRTYGVRARYSF